MSLELVLPQSRYVLRVVFCVPITAMRCVPYSLNRVPLIKQDSFHPCHTHRLVPLDYAVNYYDGLRSNRLRGHTVKTLTDFHLDQCTFPLRFGSIPSSCASMRSSLLFGSVSISLMSSRPLTCWLPSTTRLTSFRDQFQYLTWTPKTLRPRTPSRTSSTDV